MANLRRANGRKEPWKVRYFGVGNESWGCGGNMRPEFYSDNFRRYNTFVKNYGTNRVYRIACGSNGDDTNWTSVVMANVGNRMNGLSLHYYTIPSGNWGKKGPATQFSEGEWFSTLRRALEMGELVQRHSAIMDKTDPQKRIGMIVDEWGVWYDVEPGTNPGFLYQQNTLRDALVAGVTLNIFNDHCDRVKMANIAQLVNVLQSMILTDKERMLLTPTYHVFEMYKVHQDATLLTVELSAPDYKLDEKAIPSLHASASRDKAGRVHLSVINLDPHRDAQISVKVAGAQTGTITGRILTATTMDAHNTFDHPDAVKPVPFTGFERKGEEIAITLPSKSVVMLEIQ
jgi:alpha-N-arabinofuranosidase